MSGGARLRDGALIITNPDGRTNFNSNDGLLHTVNDLPVLTLKTTTLVLPSATNTNRSDDFFVAYVNGFCTDVMGNAKFSGGGVVISGSGPPVGSASFSSEAWITVMGGSAIVVYQDGHGNLSSGESNGGLWQFIYYFFFVSSGAVYLRRCVYVSKASAGGMTINPQTVACKLKVGRFT